MSKRHDAIFNDVLKGLDTPKRGVSAPKAEDRSQARFLKRSTTMADQASGVRQEKVLRLVDPASCQMWDKHNRAYDLLTEENCRDLIDGILVQGQQEFPAIVRRLRPNWNEDEGPEFEVICGARRHFAITWLRSHNYPQFRYLIEERELTDEEAFRLADIENRDREDISDLERARDYAAAVDRYYEGKQNVMAERLQVSPAWLSRYLALARLPDQVVRAFASVRDVKEVHSRQLKPLMATDAGRNAILEEAAELAQAQAAAREGQGAALSAAEVMGRLKRAANPPKQRAAADTVFRTSSDERGVQMRRRGKRVNLEFDRDLPDHLLRAAIEQFLQSRGREHQ